MTTCLEELFFQCTVHVFRENLSICMCASFQGWMWDLIVLVPDHYPSFYLGIYYSIILIVKLKSRY